MYDIKELFEAFSVEEAVRLRMEHPDADILAGGSDVLVQIREGRRAGREMISIYLVDALRGIFLEEDGTLRIGSLTSFSHITKSPLVQERIPALGEAVDQVGGPQIRNIGTIGGNTCNGVTSADSASTLLSYDAVIELTGPEGIRNVPISEFYLGAGKVDIRAGEIQTAVRILPDSFRNTFGFYYKYAMRNAMDITTTGCSVNVRLSPDQACFERVRIAYGVAAPVPVRAGTAESLVQGKPVSEESVETFARAVLEDITPRDSWRASKALRQHIAVELARRCIRESVKRAGGELQ